MDGQYFDANSPAAVQSILDQVQNLAEDAAQQGSDSKAPRIRVLGATGKPTASKALNQAIKKTQTALDRAYVLEAMRIRHEAQLDREIATLLAAKLAQEDQDEEETILALLL